MRFCIGTLFVINYGLYAQQQKIDSLTILMEIAHDSSKAEVMFALSDALYYEDFKKAKTFAGKPLICQRNRPWEDEIKSIYTP